MIYTWDGLYTLLVLYPLLGFSALGGATFLFVAVALAIMAIWPPERFRRMK